MRRVERQNEYNVPTAYRQDWLRSHCRFLWSEIIIIIIFTRTVFPLSLFFFCWVLWLSVAAITYSATKFVNGCFSFLVDDEGVEPTRKKKIATENADAWRVVWLWQHHMRAESNFDISIAFSLEVSLSVRHWRRFLLKCDGAKSIVQKNAISVYILILLFQFYANLLRSLYLRV